MRSRSRSPRRAGTTKTYTVTVTRQKQVLVLSPTATGRVYGENDPAQWEYTVAAKSGSTFASGHTASTTFFTSSPLTRASGDDVGDYAFSLVGSPSYETGMEALYTFEVASGAKYTITKKALSISTPVVLTKVYDGGAGTSGASVKSGGAVTGEVGAESFALAVSGGTYPESDVGTGLTITSPTFTLTPGSAASKPTNYEYTLPSAATGEITAAAITDVAGVTVVSRPVDGTTDATFDTTAATGAGVVSGEEAGFRAGLTVSGRFPDGAKTTANTYDVAVTYALGDSGGFDASNYTLGDSGDTLRGTVTAYATWEHLNFRVVAGDRQVTVSWDQPAGAEQIFIRWTATPGVWQSRLMSSGGSLNCITRDFPNGYRVAATAGSYVITKTWGPPINLGEATGTALENDTQVTVQVGEGPGCAPRRRAGSDREGTWKLFRVTPASTDARLSALTAAGSTDGSDFSTAVTLSPAFAAATLTYTATVARGVTHVKLTPTVTESGATVKVGKTGSLTAVRSGEASDAIALDVGANEIKVEVTQDGTTKTYTVTVTRKKPVLVLSPTATGRGVRADRSGAVGVHGGGEERQRVCVGAHGEHDVLHQQPADASERRRRWGLRVQPGGFTGLRDRDGGVVRVRGSGGSEVHDHEEGADDRRLGGADEGLRRRRGGERGEREERRRGDRRGGRGELHAGGERGHVPTERRGHGADDQQPDVHAERERRSEDGQLQLHAAE